jgi:hypothetical protein
MRLRRNPKRAASALAGVAAALAFAAPVAADPAAPGLFFSRISAGADPGADSGACESPLAGATHTLPLYLNPGSQATANQNELCDPDATSPGDEACGFEFEIRVDGDLSIASFTPEPALGTVSQNNLGTSLRVAALTTANPLLTGPQRVGTLVVTSGPGGGHVKAAMLKTVDADLDLRCFTPDSEIVYVPEPGMGWLLCSGVAGLAALQRLRARRGGLR